MTDNGSQKPTRRVFLGVVSAAGMGALAGCLGSDEELPDPISLDRGDQLCENCNMVVSQHRGPKAQAFYGDDAPTDEIADRDDSVAWFCSTWCGYNFIFDQEAQGYDPIGMYTTDYSGVSYDLIDDGGATFISNHNESDFFIDASEVTFVVDSDVLGAMGSSLIGFTDSDEAAAFADDHGGDLFADDEVTAELIAALGT